MKALITRMNDGTNTLSCKAPSSHKHVSSLVYDKYPNVPDLLLRLLTHKDVIDSERLQEGVAVPDTLLSQAQHVFPALEIIEQSGIPRKYCTEIRQASWNHLEGPVWAIRDKAAKALSYLPDSNAIETEVRRCLQSPWSRQNSLHGRLLYLRYLIIRLQSDSEGMSIYLPLASKADTLFPSRFTCCIPTDPKAFSDHGRTKSLPHYQIDLYYYACGHLRNN